MGAAVHADTRYLTWQYGEVGVSMIGPCAFPLPSGAEVRPFHRAPWVADGDIAGADGLLAGLQGEWPCVPFGYPMPAPGGPFDWPPGWPGAVEATAQVSDVHGFGSAAMWTFDTVGDDTIAMHVDYPEDHAIIRLERRGWPVPDAPALAFELVIHVRRETCKPIGLHGCFALPELTGPTVLEPSVFCLGRIHPLTVEPEAPIFTQESTFDGFDAVAARGGGTIDTTQLPFGRPGEDLLQLDGTDGHFAMAVQGGGGGEGSRMTFDWEADKLPNVLLWQSNRDRAALPRNNRHLCIGIEPVCSPFDLSPDLARSANPVAVAGTPTCLNLTPETPMTIRYRIGVKDLT